MYLVKFFNLVIAIAFLILLICLFQKNFSHSFVEFDLVKLVKNLI